MSRANQFVRGGMLYLLGAALLLFSTTARSQTSLEDALKPYSGDAAKGYIQPVADLFGANMNSGFYHGSEMSRWGFHLNVDIVAMVAKVGDAQKTYTANAPAGFSPATFQTATIFGGEGAEISNSAIPGLKFKGSDGVFKTENFPLAVPQLSIGYIFGTEATIRYISVPTLGNDKFPATTLWGAGLRHSVNQYVPGLPIDLTSGFFYQSFKTGDIIKFTGLSIGAQASKSFSILTVYTGLAWEKSTLDLTYRSTDPTAPLDVDISMTGANTFRFTGGLCLSLGFAKIFADANFGSVTCFSGGIGFGN